MSIWNNIRGQSAESKQQHAEEQRVHDLLASDDFELV